MILTPIIAWKKHRKVEKRAKKLSKAHAKMQGALFLFKQNAYKPMKFRKAGRNIIQVNNILGTKQRQIIKSTVRKQEQEMQR